MDPDQEIGPKGEKGKPIMDEFTSAFICRIIHLFCTSREHLTVDKVLAQCREEIQDLPKLGRTSLWWLPKLMDFLYQKTKGLAVVEDRDGCLPPISCQMRPQYPILNPIS